VYYDVVTGQMAHGEAYIDYDAEHTGWYLFDQATGAMAHGFVDLPDAGKRVYYDAVTGVMARGQVCIGGSWYNFDDVTGAMVRGFFYIFSQQKWVYYSDDGAMQYGERYVDGEWYLLNASTGAVSYGWQQLADGRTVYYDGVSGRMCYGEQNIGGKSYTFDSATGALTSGNGPDFTVPSEYVASSSFMDKVASGRAKSVRLFGDSIFAGVGASEFDQLSDNALFTYNDWTYYEPMSSVSCAGNWLRWKVESYGASYVSDCVPEQGSMNFFSHLDSSLYGTEDYAVVVLGTNDRGAYESDESLADYVCYAESFLTRLSTIYGGNIVVLSSAPVEYETYNYSLESADQALSGLCASHGWDFGSLYKAFEHVRQVEGFDASCLYYDGTHLNDRGQEVLWAALCQVLHVS
jgi:lysophospholipase L1-like esterase